MDKYGNFVTLTEDDKLWVATPLIHQHFLQILIDPQGWVKKYVNGKPTIAYPATISFEPIVSPEQSDPRRLWLQGIDGTNLLTIRIPTAGAEAYVYDYLDTLTTDSSFMKPAKSSPVYTIDLWIRDLFKRVLDGSPPDLKTFVKNMYYGRNIPTTIVNQDRAYAHMSLSPPHHIGLTTKLNKAYLDVALIAVFHLIAAAYPSVVDDVFNNGVPDVHSWQMTNGEVTRDLTGPTQLAGDKKYKRRQPSNTLPMTIIVRDPNSKDPLPLDTEEICEMLVAEYDSNDGSVSYCEAFSKPYSGLNVNN